METPPVSYNSRRYFDQYLINNFPDQPNNLTIIMSTSQAAWPVNILVLSLTVSGCCCLAACLLLGQLWLLLPALLLLAGPAAVALVRLTDRVARAAPLPYLGPTHCFNVVFLHSQNFQLLGLVTSINNHIDL